MEAEIRTFLSGISIEELEDRDVLQKHRTMTHLLRRDSVGPLLRLMAHRGVSRLYFTMTTMVEKYGSCAMMEPFTIPLRQLVKSGNIAELGAARAICSPAQEPLDKSIFSPDQSKKIGTGPTLIRAQIDVGLAIWALGSEDEIPIMNERGNSHEINALRVWQILTAHAILRKTISFEDSNFCGISNWANSPAKISWFKIVTPNKRTRMVRRNVLFYEIRSTRVRDVDWRLNVREMVGALDALSDEDRILNVGGNTGDSYEFAQVMERGPNPSVAFVRCREHGLPMLARIVSLEPFDIDADRQLAELTHAVFFDNHIIGAEYNHYGPGLTAFARYLEDKIPQVLPENNRVKIASLTNDDHLALLRSARSVQSLTIKTGPQMRSALNNTSPSGGRGILRALASGLQSRQSGFYVRNRNGLDRDEVIGLIDWAFEQGRNLLTAASAVVTLEDGTTQPLNLLRSRIGAEREMELISPNARSIAHGSAQIEIIAAYNALGDQIRAASSLRSSGP